MSLVSPQRCRQYSSTFAVQAADCCMHVGQPLQSSWRRWQYESAERTGFWCQSCPTSGPNHHHKQQTDVSARRHRADIGTPVTFHGVRLDVPVCSTNRLSPRQARQHLSYSRCADLLVTYRDGLHARRW